MKNLQITQLPTPRNSRSIDAYLRDIARLPRLTIDEEVSLAQRIHAGDDEALERLVLGNLRFVVSVAKKYQNRGLDFSDLVSAGNIGLVTAARRFDETYGNKFCSYAVWWIRQSILQALGTDGRTIALPANQQARLSRYNEEARLMEQELYRTPTREEVTERLGVDEINVARIMCTSEKPLSLDAPMSGDEETTWIESMADTTGERPDAGLMKESLHDDLEKCLSTLPANERNILKMSFGIDYSHPYSLDEIAMRMRLSRERVRQLHSTAIRRMSRSSTKELLRVHL